MKLLRAIRDLIKPIEVPWIAVVALVLALYLAVANILRAAKWPEETTWAVGSVPFWAVVLAAVFVPLYAFYKALDAHFEREDKEAAKVGEAELQLLEDLRLLCQQTVAAIADRCDGVEANDLAAQVWLSRDDGSFRRLVRFYLPEERKSSGIEWKRGHGVAGTAWEAGEDLYADLTPLRRKAQRLSPQRFNGLPPGERYGMTAKEVKASAYSGICALQLFSSVEGRPLLGFFIVDYVGKSEFDCVSQALASRPASIYVAGCERLLTDGPEMMGRP